MPNSKRTEKEIKNRNKKAYVGDKKVEEKLQRIEFSEFVGIDISSSPS